MLNPAGIAKLFWAYMAVVGLITFPLFIMEESIQTATWGTWSAQTAKDPKLQLAGIRIIEKINIAMDTINRTLGWIQPLSMLSYDAYSQATQIYVDSVRAKLLAHDPEVFEGERVSCEFTPRTIQVLEDGRYLLQNGKIAVIVDTEPKMEPMKIEGIMRQVNGRMTIVKE